MKILQLCCFSNKWKDSHDIENIDLSIGKDVFSLPNDYGKGFDFILAAPPCTQFTKANSSKWLEFPEDYVNIALKCFIICLESGKPWVLENPPGRITKFIEELKPYRMVTLSDIDTNKEWVLYSNILLTRPNNPRYGKKSINNFGIVKRNEYPRYFYEYLEQQLNLYQQNPAQQPGLNELLKNDLKTILARS